MDNDLALGPAYVFLDEGGNFDFSPRGSKFFTITSIYMKRPFTLLEQLSNLRLDLIEEGLDIEYLHASEDRQPVRNKVFKVIGAHLEAMRIDSVIVRKNRTWPSVRDDSRFYPKMVGYLLKYLVDRIDLKLLTELIVITDKIPITRKRNAVEKAVKMTLATMLPSDVKYRTLHHASKSCAMLQVADYANWAIFRKWEAGDDRSHKLIQKAIRSEFDIFQRGIKDWY